MMLHRPSHYHRRYVCNHLPPPPPLFQQERYYASNPLVIVETNSSNSQSMVANSTLSTISAARKLSDDKVSALVFTHNGDRTIAEQVSRLQGVHQVLWLNKEQFKHNISEILVSAMEQVQKKYNYSHILCAHTVFGKDLLPRLAATLDVSPVMDVIQIDGEDVFMRPIYAGNALCTVQSTDAIKLLTIRPTAFEKVSVHTSADNTVAAKIEAVDNHIQLDESLLNRAPRWISEELSKSDRPELTSARVVVSGGRGLKNGENFKILYELADKLHGAVGATRAAVDEGYVPNDMQVGQTGKVVAPELYIAVGISGAIQHLAGMKDSKTIVAINKDPEAPIFQVADYGLVADLFQAVPELTKKL
jgi:electron transfer flavoprotein alpha subunit